MNPIRTIFLPAETDIPASEVIGKALSPEQFKTRVRCDTDVFLQHNGDDGKTKTRLLFSFRKTAIPENEKWFAILNECFDTPILKSDRRLRATGSHKARAMVRSGVIGYYDRLTPQQKSLLGVHMAGRRTSFLRRHPDRWSRCVPFLKIISSLYRKTCPRHYKTQKAFVEGIESELRIPGTVFTTATVNQSWATHTHTDKGDFPGGMSCLAVLGKGFKGGFLGFPLRGILVEMRPGDLIMMDSHEPHGNTPLELREPDGKRISMVCYARTDLQKFHRRVDMKTGETFFIPSHAFH